VKIRPSLVTALALGAGLTHAPTPLCAAEVVHAQVDLAEEADLKFSLGVEAYRSGRFVEALEHLLASNRLAPNQNVVFNIARCYEQLGRFPEAFRHYADYRAAQTDAERRAEADRALERIRPQVALVEVTSVPPGATIYLDRRDLGARGVTPRVLAVPPGAHEVLLELAGHEPARATGIDAATGATRTVSLPLERILGAVRLEGTPAGAEVRLEGGPADAAPLCRLPCVAALPPGARTLRVSAPGHRDGTVAVTLEPRRETTARVALDLLTGALVVDADEPGALVEVDGVASGFTPTVIDDVPVGEHRLRVTTPGFRPYETTLNLAPDARVPVTAALEPLYEVTAASRESESIDDAPASVTLITREEIRAFGHETLYDALGGTRGVFQTDDRTYQALGFRGFSRPGDYGNRVLVLLDGHTMNDDQTGSSYVGRDFQSDLQDVRRIEVVRGPGSALYGSSAFLGVVNVVTDDLPAVPHPHASLAADGKRTLRARVGGGHRFSDDLGFSASASGTKSQGDDLSLDPLGPVSGADRAESATLALKVFVHDVTVQANYNRREKRIPTGTFGTLLGDARAHTEDERAFGEVRFAPDLGDRLTLDARLFADVYRFHGDYPYEAPPADVGLLKDTFDGRSGGGEVRLRIGLIDSLDLTIGAQGRAALTADLASRTESGPTLDADATEQVYSGYAVVDWRPVSPLTVALGARVDHFTETGTSLSPRLALIARPWAAGVTKLIAGQAFRAPSAYERLYADGGQTQIVARDLTAERVQTLEIEHTEHLPWADLAAIGSVYYNRIVDLIDLSTRVVTSPGQPDAELLQYRNLDEETETLGAEAELRREWRQGWMLSTTYAYQRTRLGGLGDGTPISNSPTHLAGFKLAAPLARSGATLANRVRFESGRRTEGGGHTEAPVHWDLTVTGAVPALHLEWGLGVRNLLDSNVEHPVSGEYAPLTTVPQPGRTFFAAVTLTL
jgi:outer membrane receptor for ferrienterochelin and colicins